MFPFVMPSSIDPASSLRVSDSVSHHTTLAIMFAATVVFMPIIILYAGQANRVMARKVTVDFVCAHVHSAYWRQTRG
jgi:cytochrome d ubiquinol oxidase subunit II